MKTSLLTVATWIFLALVTALPAQAQAPSGAPVPGGVQKGTLRIETVTPDFAKREQTHTLTYRNNVLTSENITYLDGTLKLREFRAKDGTLYSEVETPGNGGALRLTMYADDGIGKKEETITGPRGRIQTTLYRQDGKTAWKVTTSEIRQRSRIKEVEYLDAAGKVVTLKQLKQGLSTFYTVYDDKGKEVYQQEWVSGEASDILLSVTETTSDGTRRRVHILDKKVVSLKEDGSVDKTSPYDSSSEQVAPERLKTPAIPKP